MTTQHSLFDDVGAFDVRQPVRVYQVNEYEWYAATSREQAIAELVSCVGEEEAERQMEGVFPVELTDQQMQETVFLDSDGIFGESGKQYSFAEALQHYLTTGWIAPFGFAMQE